MSGERVKVSVDADSLRKVLMALNGADHLIRELQYTMGPLFPDNPIKVLTDSYNEAVRAHNATQQPTSHGAGVSE